MIWVIISILFIAVVNLCIQVGRLRSEIGKLKDKDYLVIDKGD